MHRSWMAAAVLVVLATGVARAQDVPGIELCTAEKTMERRTGCLQSNINFLKSALTKMTLDSHQKLDAANRQIDALKATVAGLQAAVTQLQGQVEALTKKPAATGTPAKDSSAKDAPKAPEAK